MSAAAPDTRLKGRTRWSMAARCPRQAAYAFFGADPEPLDEETVLLMERGKLDQQWVIENILVPQHGRENLELEKAIPWPATGLPVGELHSDVFIKTDGMPVEIKSHASGEISDDDFTQLAGEIHFDPDAGDAGALICVDRNLRREVIPVLLNEELVERVETIAADVVNATRTGVLPDRVCQKPGDARGKLCPFARVCFEDWEPPDAVVLDGDVAELAPQLYEKRKARDTAKAAYDEADAEYKLLTATAAELDLEPGVDYLAGGFRLRRTYVRSHEEISLGKARKAGIWLPEDDVRFGPFVRLVGEHNRWTIEPAAAVPRERIDPAEFGDEAPF